MAKKTRNQLLDDWEKHIRNAMARTLWVTSYADYVDELSPEEREAILGTEQHPDNEGRDWDDVAPEETPQGAHQAARDLAELFAVSEGIGRRRPMTELFEMAHHADTGEPLELEHMFGDEKRKAPQWEMFGHYMVMQALGHGVSWFDDHKEFDLEVPSFECSYDGVELFWSGKAAEGWDAGHASGQYAHYGWSSVMFTPNGFEKVLRSVGIKPEKSREIAVDIGSTIGTTGWYWSGKDIDFVTEVNPITGEWERGVQGTFKKDYAGAIAIRGLAPKVRKAVEFVEEFAEREMHGGTDTRAITFGEMEGPPKLRNPCDAGATCTDEYHRALKADPEKWAALELKGVQDRKRYPGQVLEFRDCPRCHTTMALPRENPSNLTAKGERMYHDIEESYEDRGEPRAKEIASRTVQARARDGVPGLVKGRR